MYQPNTDDAHEYIYPGTIRSIPAAPPLTGPERMQQEIDDLRQRVEHLELIVHRLLNQEGEL